MTTQAGNAENIAAVRRVFDRWIKSVQTRNLEGITDAHSSDVVMFDVPTPPQFRGLDEYRNTWSSFFKWFGDEGVFEPSELSISAGEDVAFSHCLIRCEGSQGGGSYLPVRLTIGYRKIGGQWTIVHEHHSVPQEAAS
jgi:ketosteroid isomerase-like protein